MKTMGQQRSAFALQKLKCIQDIDDKDKFASFVAGAPAAILQNGFGQAMAFWLAKAWDKKGKQFKEKDKHYVLYSFIMEWLNKRNMIDRMDPEKDPKVFVTTISNIDQAKYLAAQQETLKFLEWVKRYANAGIIGG